MWTLDIISMLKGGMIMSFWEKAGKIAGKATNNAWYIEVKDENNDYRRISVNDGFRALSIHVG